MDSEDLLVLLNFFQCLILLAILYLLFDIGNMAETGLREFLRN